MRASPLVQAFPHGGMLAKTIFAAKVTGLGFLALPVLSAAALKFALRSGKHS